MRSTAQEVFTHIDVRNKICDCVGEEVMKLGTKKVQETPKKMDVEAE